MESCIVVFLTRQPACERLLQEFGGRPLMVVLLLDVQLPVPCIRLYLGGGGGAAMS